MRKVLIRVAVLAVVAAGAAVAFAAPAAAAPKTTPTDFITEIMLKRYCTRDGGSFNAAPDGSSYYCVYPDGHVIICSNTNRWCVEITRTDPVVDNPWVITPPVVRGDLVPDAPAPPLVPTEPIVSAAPVSVR